MGNIVVSSMSSETNHCALVEIRSENVPLRTAVWTWTGDVFGSPCGPSNAYVSTVAGLPPALSLRTLVGLAPTFVDDAGFPNAPYAASGIWPSHRPCRPDRQWAVAVLLQSVHLGPL